MDINEIIGQELAEFARDYDRPRRDYGDRKPRKPKEWKAGDEVYARNREMGDETYALKKKAMSYIYEAKNLVKRTFGVDMPRITLRIVDYPPESIISRNFLGCATGYGTDTVLIPAPTFEKKYSLKHIVFHEILHAAYCVPHIESSPLMKPVIGLKPLPDEELNRLFIEHVKESGKIKKR